MRLSLFDPINIDLVGKVDQKDSRRNEHNGQKSVAEKVESSRSYTGSSELSNPGPGKILLPKLDQISFGCQKHRNGDSSSVYEEVDDCTDPQLKGEKKMGLDELRLLIESGELKE